MKKSKLLFGIIIFFVPNAFAASEGLSKDQIHKNIQKNMNDVFSCYNDKTVTQSNLKGTILLSFDIHTDGRIMNSVIEKTTLNNSNVEACVVEKSKTWIFPKPKGSKPVHVKYPFKFVESKEK